VSPSSASEAVEKPSCGLDIGKGPELPVIVEEIVIEPPVETGGDPEEPLKCPLAGMVCRRVG